VAEAPSSGVAVSLDAVVVAVTDETPKVLAVADPAGGPPRLPSGRLEPADRTLELALRRFVREQAGLEVGYVEQLYTFGDLERGPAPGPVPALVGVPRRLTVAYLALVRETAPSPEATWVDWYDLYPWEDHRGGRPPVLAEVIVPFLEAWDQAAPALHRQTRQERSHVSFGLAGAPWDGVRVLERYELLYEVGLLAESARRAEGAPALGLPMQRDDRRIVATALGRLRGKLTYRPVVFELLASSFTLLQLQRLVEALAGVELHKGNFRRLVEGAGLVEGTGSMARTGGRPAELFRFRREVLRERPRPGIGTPWTRA
jgi:hypothetical protein